MIDADYRGAKPMTTACLPGRTVQRGMTLIEILVAIVVLSIGLLGLAGLQLKGLQVGQGSTYRWQAAMLAQDVLDRMRADRASALAGNYVLPGGTPTGATAATITDWQNRVTALPGGTSTITFPNGVGTPQVRVEVDWIDTRANAGAGGTGAAQGAFIMQTEL
jgi:type IV pilus assembly protein PilV